MALAIIASSSCSKQEVDGSEAQTISVKENNLARVQSSSLPSLLSR